MPDFAYQVLGWTLLKSSGGYLDFLPKNYSGSITHPYNTMMVLKVEKYPNVSYLTKAITTETSQSSQFSLTVDVNFPRNSIIIT
jgi:hypothetical protein